MLRYANNSDPINVSTDNIEKTMMCNNKIVFVLKLVGQAMDVLHPFLTDEEVESAIAVLRHSADEETIREKMKITFSYRHAIVNDHDKSGDVFSVFPRFLDTPGLVRHLHSLKSETYCNM